jgi:hypothetical protein
VTKIDYRRCYTETEQGAEELLQLTNAAAQTEEIKSFIENPSLKKVNMMPFLITKF